MWRLHTFIVMGLLTVQAQPLPEELQLEYTAGGWSQPASIILPSATGPVQASKKSTGIERKNPRYSEHYALDIVSSAKFADLVTPPADKYLVFRGRICGIYCDRADLNFRFAPLDPGEAPQRLLEAAVAKLVRDPLSAFERGEAVFRFDLTFVFGSDFFGPHDDARGPIYSVSLTDTYFQQGNLVIKLSNKLHPSMTVTIDSKMNLIAASDAGSDLMLLRSGRRSPALSGWGGPARCRYGILTKIYKFLVVERLSRIQTVRRGRGLTRLRPSGLLMVCFGSERVTVSWLRSEEEFWGRESARTPLCS